MGEGADGLRRVVSSMLRRVVDRADRWATALAPRSTADRRTLHTPRVEESLTARGADSDSAPPAHWAAIVAQSADPFTYVRSTPAHDSSARGPAAPPRVATAPSRTEMKLSKARTGRWPTSRRSELIDNDAVHAVPPAASDPLRWTEQPQGPDESVANATRRAGPDSVAWPTLPAVFPAPRGFDEKRRNYHSERVEPGAPWPQLPDDADDPSGPLDRRIVTLERLADGTRVERERLRVQR